MNTNAPGTPGTGEPGSPTPTPGTGEQNQQPQYVTKEDFGKTAALIGGMQKTLQALQTGMLTADKLAEIGLVEKVDENGNTVYRPKTAAPATPAPGKKSAADGDDDPTIKRIKALETELANERKAKSEALERGEKETLNRAVVAALTKAGAVNADRDVVHVVSQVLKGDQGYIGKGKDQYGAEIELSLDQVCEEFLKKNPELKKASTQPGSGTPAGQQSGGGRPGQKVIPRSQWADMNWFAQNSAKFHSGEFVRGN